MFRPAIMRVTKSLANSVVRAGIGVRTTMGRLSTGSVLTCKGFLSGSQKISDFHSLKIIEVQLHLKIILLSGVFVCDCEFDISK